MATPNHADEPTGYASTTARLVPGFADMHRMAAVLLAERTPEDGRVLVVGAGGGAELATFTRLHPGWRFDGIDPSAEMIRAAVATLGASSERVTFHRGYVDAAPMGPFDAATCLLTLHFTTASERQRTLRAIHDRLRPGAPFVVAHLSFGQDEERDLWLARYAAFATSSGVDAAKAAAGAAAIRDRLEILSPERDAALIAEAGFVQASTFYVGLCFRGWVVYA